LCATPSAVAVTSIEYVPAGVLLLVGLGGTFETPPPPPEQLVALVTRTAKKARSINALRRDLHTSGNISNPHVNGIIFHGLGRIDSTEADACPVAICTVRLPVVFAATDSLVGLKVHAACTGSVPHAKVNVPADPFAGDSANVYRAVSPLEIVWLDPPVIDAEKSKPIPESGTWALAVSMLLATVRFPVC
jgi:hypothetical protein